MPKKKRSVETEEEEMTLLEKAKSHAVKRQSKKAATPEELAVYIAWFNGDIDTGQATFALGIPLATFRGNAGTTLRNAIAAGKYELDEV